MCSWNQRIEKEKNSIGHWNKFYDEITFKTLEASSRANPILTYDTIEAKVKMGQNIIEFQR